MQVGECKLWPVDGLVFLVIQRKGVQSADLLVGGGAGGWRGGHNLVHHNQIASFFDVFCDGRVQSVDFAL